MASNYWHILLIIPLIVAFLLNVLFTKVILQSTRKQKSQKPEKVIVFLGSGGHTGEMLKILHTYKDTLKHSSIVVLYSEENSLARFKLQFPDIKNVKFHMIGKAREVGSGKISSIKSIVHTLLSVVDIVIKDMNYFVIDHKRTLILLNGPGSCVLLSMIFQFIKLITIKDHKHIKIVYVESLARCNKLSMTGVIIYYMKFADEFLVQWPEMLKSYPYAKSYGILV
ncbi:unnamed protein product [Hanseniaspora opuntiae]